LKKPRRASQESTSTNAFLQDVARAGPDPRATINLLPPHHGSIVVEEVIDSGDLPSLLTLVSWREDEGRSPPSTAHFEKKERTVDHCQFATPVLVSYSQDTE